MITQELTDYVKTQLSAGVAREQITSDLLGQGGWTMEQINEAFQVAQQGSLSSVPSTNKNIWNKFILITNWATLFLMLGITFFITLPLDQFLVETSPLPGFAQDIYDMLLVSVVIIFGIFTVFVGLENFVFRKSFRDQVGSALDPWITVLIFLRNILLVLSVLPFVRLVTIDILFFVAIPWVITYFALVLFRYKSIKKEIVA